MSSKLLNALIIFVFLFSVVFFSIATQVNYLSQSNPGQYSTGTGETSGGIKD